MAENCHSGYLCHCENLTIKTRKNEIDKNANAWKNFRNYDWNYLKREDPF